MHLIALLDKLCMEVVGKALKSLEDLPEDFFPPII